jgi:catechol 2,3-dioxygenase-like lactoylglutathione lyase family enzyme
MIASLRSIVIDAPDIDALANFYESVLGWPRVYTGDDWITISDGTTRLAFQLAPDLQPPQWPDPSRPQQFHLDLLVEDKDAAHAEVLRLGARLLDEAPNFNVYADPVGHPFCLVFSVDE